MEVMRSGVFAADGEVRDGPEHAGRRWKHGRLRGWAGKGRGPASWGIRGGADVNDEQNMMCGVT